MGVIGREDESCDVLPLSLPATAEAEEAGSELLTEEFLDEEASTEAKAGAMTRGEETEEEEP